ncbi:hypothetical protein BR141012304_20641 [Brucella inopinata]|nr:hypothetical protein BR141012304_20641 [Brucella inopinata]
MRQDAMSFKVRLRFASQTIIAMPFHSISNAPLTQGKSKIGSSGRPLIFYASVPRKINASFHSQPAFGNGKNFLFIGRRYAEIRPGRNDGSLHKAL